MKQSSVGFPNALYLRGLNVSVLSFLRLFCRMRNRSLVSEREFTRLVDRSATPSSLPSLGSKLLFVFPLTNAQLDLTKEKMSSNGSANVKHSETMSQQCYVNSMWCEDFVT